MRITVMCLSLVFGLMVVSPASAVQIFSFAEDFEGGLGQWTGTGGGAHNGQIVSDPLNAGNNVLNFTQRNSAGDIFTTATIDISAIVAPVFLSFDYLGTLTADSGGFLGLANGQPGTHVWPAGTNGAISSGGFLLASDGAWHSYTINVSDWVANTPLVAQFHIMMEDFVGSDGNAGNAYFDNITVSHEAEMPEPGSMALFALGAIGLVGCLRRRRAA